MLSVGKQNHYTNCRSQRGANKHTQSHSSCLNARLAQKQPEDKVPVEPDPDNAGEGI